MIEYLLVLDNGFNQPILIRRSSFEGDDMHIRRFALATALTFCSISQMSQTMGAELSVDFVLSGFVDSRERLREGAFRCRGTKIDEDPKTGRFQGDFSIFSCFSYEAGKTRFDRIETAFMPTKTSGWKPVPVEQGGKHVKLPDKTITWLEGERGVLIRSATSKAPAQIGLLDVRIIGVAPYINYEQSTPFEQIISDYRGWIGRSNGITTRRDQKIVRIEWSDRGRRMFLEFDESRGYIPVRLEYADVDKNGKVVITDRSTVEWKQINKVWVPEHVTVANGMKPGRTITYDYRFEWEKVNEPVAPELFTTRGMGLPEDTLIAAVDGKRTIQLGSVGDMTPNPKLLALEAGPAKPWWQRWPGWLAGVGTLATLVGGVYLWRRRARANTI
jgi:hypothetical protein